MNMKDTLYSLAFIGLLLLATAGLTAQVSTRVQAMSRGDNAALVLELPTAEDGDVEDLWEDWLKDTYKVRTKDNKRDKKGELASLNFDLPGVGGGSKVDMYSTIEEIGDGSELTVWIATPKGYVSPSMDRNQYMAAEKMLMNFALAVSKVQIEQDVENEEDRLEELQDDLEDLQKDKKRAEDDIEDARKKIAELEEEIRENIRNQERKREEINAQMSKVDQTKAKLKEF